MTDLELLSELKKELRDINVINNWRKELFSKKEKTVVKSLQTKILDLHYIKDVLNTCEKCGVQHTSVYYTNKSPNNLICDKCNESI